MDLTFQVPVLYCSLWHGTLLSPPDTSTTERCFRFGPATSFFLGTISISPPLFPSSILDTFGPGGLLFRCPIFLSLYTVHEILMASILGWFAVTSSRIYTILYVVSAVCVYQSQAPKSSTTPLSPNVHTFCSLCLCLYFGFANRFICTIFSRFRIYVLIFVAYSPSFA